jgi:flagellar biosynthetic protein FliR
MIFTDAQIAQFLQQYMYPFFRIGMLFMTMPVIGTRLAPARVRVALAFAVTIIVVPMLPPIGVTPSLSLETFLTIGQELLIGAAVGFAFQVVFQVFVLSGQFMAMKMGLGFASMNDPANGVQTTVLSQFFLLLATLLFLAINGHLILLTLIVESFHALPPGVSALSRENLFSVASLGSWMFAGALVISLPVLTSLLVVNIAFGVMSRAAPQLNIFAVGFPFTLMCGLALIWVGMAAFSTNFNIIINEGFNFVHQVLSLR